MRTGTGEASDDLPTLINVFSVRIETREFVGTSPLPSLRILDLTPGNTSTLMRNLWITFARAQCGSNGLCLPKHVCWCFQGGVK